MRRRLEYRDFRPYQPNDPGYSPQLKSKELYFSPSEGVTISKRQFQKAARGGITNEQLAKQNKRRKIEEKIQRKKKAKKVEKPSVPKKPRKKSAQSIAKAIQRRREKYRKRVDFLKESFARKRSKQIGMDIDWDSMNDLEKTEFWEAYHNLVDNEPPSEDEVDMYYDDYFDLDYQDYEDIEYGPSDPS